MPPVLGAVAAVAAIGSVAATVAGTAILGISAGIFSAISLGATVGASLLTPKPKAPENSKENIDRLRASIDPRTPRKTVIGWTALATDIRDEEFTEDQSYFNRFIVCASHAVHSIDEIWFDNQLAWTAAGGVQGEFAGYLGVNVRTEGNASNVIDISSRMGATRRYTGLAYVHLRYKRTGNSKKTESPFAQSITTRITIRGKGASLYDPRLDSTVPGGSGGQRADDQATWVWDDSACRNPALALLFYLLGYRINGKLAVGKGIPLDRIDLESFAIAANLCDEIVDGEPRYRCDGAWSEGDSPTTVIDMLKACMNADLDDLDGKLRLTIFRDDIAAPVTDFHDEDILGAFEWQPFPALNDSFNIVRGVYTDPSDASLYQPVDYPQVSTASPDGIDRIDTFNLPMVESPAQAQRLAQLRLNRQGFSGVFKADFQATAWRVQKNSQVRLTFAPTGFVNKLFRVAEIDLRVDGVTPMVLIEEDPDLYVIPPPANPIIPIDASIHDPNYDPLLDAINTPPVLPSDGEGDIVDENGDPYKGGDLRNDALELFPDGNLVFYPTPPLPGIPPVEMIQIGRVTPQGLEVATQASMTQADHAIDLLANAALQAQLLSDQNRQMLTGAGIYVDEATGEIKLAAHEYAQDRLNDVSIRLDAHDASINLKATYAYVDSAIATAVLDPSQIPAFSNIDIRLSTVEINLDAMAGAIDLLATTVEVNALRGRVTTAEQTIDSLNAQISLKVETTQFELLQTRVSNAEITLSAIGDVASIEESVRIARLVPRDVEALAQQTLASLLSDEKNRQQSVELVAEASNQLTASIVDNNAVQAQRTQELAARVYNTETGLTAAQGSIVTVQTALVSATESLADDISTLTVTVGQNKAEATSQLTTLVNQTSATAADLLQLESEVDGNLALLQTQYYTKANTDSAIAASVSVLDASIFGLNAALWTEEQARVDGDGALSASVTGLTATVNNNHSTLSAAITTEQQARVNADGVLAGSVSTLQTTVGNHTTTISQHTSSINGIRARWGVDIDVNGRVVGAVRLDGSASESTFDVVADKFRVYNGSLDAPVFQISAGNVYLRGNLIQGGSITTAKVAVGAITVPYTMDGPASTYCPVGSQVIVLEMPSVLTVGDAADGGCVIMFFGEIDSAANKDMGLLLRMFVAVNNGPYVLVGTNKGGMRTEGGNTFFDMPVALMHSVTSAYNVRVQVTAQPYLLDNASDTRPGYMRNVKLAIFGGMR